MNNSESLPAQVAGEVASAFLPGVGPVVERMFAAAKREWSRNRSRAMAAAEKAAGMSREDLAEELELNPQLVPLATRLLWEAAMTDDQQHLEAMGAVFGQAAASPNSDTEDPSIILIELSHLRAEDILILRAMRPHEFVFLEAPHEKDDTRGNPNTAARLGEEMSVEEEAVSFGLRRLAAHGFAYTYPGPVLGGTRYYLSSLGKTLCEALDLLHEP